MIDVFSKIHKTVGCWIWTGTINYAGYGVHSIKIDGKWRYRKAHRLIYQLLVGEIPEEYTIDHTCHNKDKTCKGGKTCLHRRCVNPDHLEPVTLDENKKRGLSIANLNAKKTHCPKGHPYDEINTKYDTRGERRCIACYELYKLRLRTT